MSDFTAISPNAAAMAVSSMQQAGQAEEVAMAMARKALDLQAQGAASLIDALPPQPTTLATSGSLGTRFNGWA